jgi:hypothetical protein
MRAGMSGNKPVWDKGGMAVRIIISIICGIALCLLVMITTHPAAGPVPTVTMLGAVFWAGAGHAWQLNRQQ